METIILLHLGDIAASLETEITIFRVLSGVTVS